ncbi:hypothetical protein KFK09_017678 [Dendrobium nobile]|uniref:Uncharacterized protein n=1 Tax=Dendrobium nobile TaxID=94219 RepID=A0A8T3ATU4_DENNO|nr:hypothetical protein KFK09_017678 [Dendrobium nobile]
MQVIGFCCLARMEAFHRYLGYSHFLWVDLLIVQLLLVHVVGLCYFFSCNVLGMFWSLVNFAGQFQGYKNFLTSGSLFVLGDLFLVDCDELTTMSLMLYYLVLNWWLMRLCFNGLGFLNFGGN